MAGKEIEQRVFAVRELRFEGEADAPEIVGYAAVFGLKSEDLGGFRELIRPGAFSKTLLDGADVRALWQHNAECVLGRTKSGTLTLTEDEIGLGVRIKPPDTQWARDAIASMRRGDVDQMSFGFETVRDDWALIGEQVVRTLIEVKLFDVSPVTFPAYPQTTAQVRSAFEAFTAAPGEDAHPAEEGAEDEEEARARLEHERRRLDLSEKQFKFMEG